MRGPEDDSKPTGFHDKLTRRSFLSRAGAVGVATATATVATPFVAAEVTKLQEPTGAEADSGHGSRVTQGERRSSQGADRPALYGPRHTTRKLSI